MTRLTTGGHVSTKKANSRVIAVAGLMLSDSGHVPSKARTALWMAAISSTDSTPSARASANHTSGGRPSGNRASASYPTHSRRVRSTMGWNTISSSSAACRMRVMARRRRVSSDVMCLRPAIGGLLRLLLQEAEPGAEHAGDEHTHGEAQQAADHEARPHAARRRPDRGGEHALAVH